MSAWFAGDFERCLALCDAVRHRDPATRTNVTLLQARALLRLDRADDALQALRDAAAIPAGTDESITTRMLTGAALVRRGDVDAGLAVLLAASAEARSAHPTIRSELALNIGLAHYSRKGFEAADRALGSVASDADIVYARAMHCRARIAMARGNNDRAAQLCIVALAQLDASRHHDAFFEANTTRLLAHLALERFDREAWSVVAARRARIDAAADGLAEPLFWIAYCACAYQSDVEGDLMDAAREARRAEAIAPTDAYRVLARCKRAGVARYAGEVNGHRDHLESALELFESLNADALPVDEKLAPAILAEEMAGVDSTRATALFATYAALAPLPPIYMSHSPANEAFRALIEATVAEHRGDTRLALERYRRAFGLYVRIRYVRRAATAALRIARLAGDRKMLGYADRVTAQLSPRSWMRRDVDALKSRGIKLTDVQREVLILICQGKSNPEIARLRDRSLHTVRNLVARLFEILEVKSREELAVECVRRGIYSRS
jgi:DNA-binding CsgD family transcriptional regulator